MCWGGVSSPARALAIERKCTEACCKDLLNSMKLGAGSCLLPSSCQLVAGSGSVQRRAFRQLLAAFCAQQQCSQGRLLHSHGVWLTQACRALLRPAQTPDWGHTCQSAAPQDAAPEIAVRAGLRTQRRELCAAVHAEALQHTMHTTGLAGDGLQNASCFHYQAHAQLHNAQKETRALGATHA